jgi:ketosteroid isomerase-like protein
MTTKEAIQGYFAKLEHKDGWEACLADDVVFTSLTSPVKQLAGKENYLRATQRFYSTIAAVEVRDLLVDGDKACALTRYRIHPPNGGAAFQSDVAEVFTVKNDRIAALSIYFDTSPYPK